jgi:hypothetical protein
MPRTSARDWVPVEMPPVLSCLLQYTGWRCRFAGRAAGLVLAGLLIAIGASAAIAESENAFFTESFDGAETSWRLGDESRQQRQLRVLSHRRNRHIMLEGRASENLEIATPVDGLPVRLIHTLPAGRAIDDLKLSVWFRSNRNGATLNLRVVFPHHRDPSTGLALSTTIAGDQYTKAGHWQELTCTTVERQINAKLVLLRAHLRTSNIETREMYVDRAILSDHLGAGTTEYFFDDLRFGPVVGLRAGTPTAGDRTDERKKPPVEFRLGRLFVEGRPFFPRLTPYHYEDPDGLRRLGLNTVWIPDYQDAELMANLRARGLWMTASPPRALSPTGTILKASEVSLIPFSQETAPILFWNMGTRIPPSSHDDLMSSIEQVRMADNEFRRPLLADVTGMERVVSRYVAMLGGSRHIINTSFSLKDYRDWLIRKSRLARPGSFIWTWIQTEAATTSAQVRRQAGHTPIVIEPEQIRLQVYAALAAGCQGIGYWKSTSLEYDSPGTAELRAVLAQINLELELLEPWLASGTLVEQVPFEIYKSEPATVQQSRRSGRSSLSLPVDPQRDAKRRGRDPQPQLDELSSGEFEAAIIRSDLGTLILPVWYERDAQYVPGRLAAKDVTFVVPGVPNTASAWEVTTTEIRNLHKEDAPGGRKITLRKFDQTAAIIFTSNQHVIEELRRKVAETAEHSSRLGIDLAKAKLQRVREVDDELKSLGFGLAESQDLLRLAAGLAEEAIAAHRRGDFSGSRHSSADCLQLLRILQRLHWENAVRGLSSPNSSPHTVCFQTLPDHWRMIARIGRSQLKADGNILRSGDFEDIDTMVTEGWRHEQNETEGLRAAAELYPLPRSGNFCLRMVAVPATGADPPPDIRRSPVVVVTPALTVHSGQIVHVSGWIRLASPISGTLDGATLHDSLTGSAGALRWHGPSDWQRFELIREIPESGELELTLSLHGMGEVHFDDLQVVPHTPKPEHARGDDPSESTLEKNSRPSALEFLQRLPKLNPLKSKD